MDKEITKNPRPPIIIFRESSDELLLKLEAMRRRINDIFPDMGVVCFEARELLDHT